MPPWTRHQVKGSKDHLDQCHNRSARSLHFQFDRSANETREPGGLLCLNPARFPDTINRMLPRVLFWKSSKKRCPLTACDSSKS